MKCSLSIHIDLKAYIQFLTNSSQHNTIYMAVTPNITKTLSGKQSQPAVPVKDEQGNPIFGKEGQMDRWRQHFSQLLNRPVPENVPDIMPARIDLPLNVEPPTKEEIEEAIKQLKSAKAAGPDYIPPEALKAESPQAQECFSLCLRRYGKKNSFHLNGKKDT